MNDANVSAVLGLIADMQPREPYMLSIDGRCAAGKTTLANELSQSLNCNIVHMDDFYLPFALRTPERMAQPGGNIEFERLKNEIILPLKSGSDAVYRPYACHEDRFLPSVRLSAAANIIIEGSYSCHPCLADMIGIKVLWTLRRISSSAASPCAIRATLKHSAQCGSRARNSILPSAPCAKGAIWC